MPSNYKSYMEMFSNGSLKSDKVILRLLLY